MPEILLYSYVEDAPSAEIAKKIVAVANRSRPMPLIFREGFPSITRGYGQIKAKTRTFTKMAAQGLHLLVITDLDKLACAPVLIREWFGIRPDQPIVMPTSFSFRVAVREVESWIIADRDAWANYISIPKDNFSATPELLPDPKSHVLSVIRRKGRKRLHRDMLPAGSASIGPRYNEILCEFIKEHWVPDRALARAKSLERAMTALLNM
jgi:hypothetical protein